MSYRSAYILSNNSIKYKLSLSTKYLLMRARRYIYPDTFCIPYFVTDSYKLYGVGDKITGNNYDLVFSELYAHDNQLQYLNSLVNNYPDKIVLILGPPNVLSGKTSSSGFDIIKEILHRSKLVLAYSHNLKEYYLNLAPGANIQLFNWPFDLNTITKICCNKKNIEKNSIDILLNTPLRFNDENGINPFQLKELFTELFASFDTRIIKKIKLHTFVYSKEDKTKFISEKYDLNFPIILQKKRSFSRFTEFLLNTDAVINFTRHGVLGRITLLSATLNKPGIFSNSSEIINSLYPSSTVSNDYIIIKKRISELIEGLLNKAISSEYYPNKKYIMHYGDFNQSSAHLKKLLSCS